MTTPTRKPIVLVTALALVFAVLPAAQADYESGLKYFRAGNYVEAAAEFQALVDQSPEYHYGYYILGLSFLKLDKLEEAEKNFRKALELNADKFEYHHGLANSLMARKKYRDVVKVLEPAEGLAADNNQKYALYSMRGFANASQRKWAEAIDDLQKAKALKSSNPVVVQLGKAYYALGHNDKAVPLFQAAVAANPNDFETQQLLAEAQIKLGKEATSDATKKRHYDAAMTAAEKCRSLNPNDFEAINLVGKAALGAGEYPKAVSAFSKVLELRPDYCYAMINLGKTYIAQEKWREAEKPMQSAGTCSPREATIWESLGLIYQKYGSEEKDSAKAVQHYKQALEYYDKATQIKPSGFVRAAVDTINKNLGVIEHNVEMDALAREQDEEAARLAALQAEEERKRKEWEEKRKRDQ